MKYNNNNILIFYSILIIFSYILIFYSDFAFQLINTDISHLTLFTILTDTHSASIVPV
jgi:hypothetical protein